MVGKRIRLARRAAGLTQEALSALMGFKDRQILSAIESGTRNLRAKELTSLMRRLGKTLDYFTDPFILLPEEGEVSWRARAPKKTLDDIEPDMRSVLAAYREFGYLLHEPHIQLSLSLDVKKKDSYERVVLLGEGLSSTWNLGLIPAGKLQKIIENELHILFLALDIPEGVSGAAVRLPEFSAVIVNRMEPYYRRNFNMAHEIFHLLTWKDLPPRRIDTPAIGTPKEREEYFAEAFAAGLLMPRKNLWPRWRKRGSMSETEWINTTAKELNVSGEALYWRLVNLGWMKKSAVKSLNHLRKYGGEKIEQNPLKPYSRIFVKKLHMVFDQGFVSVRRAARLLNCTIEDLADLFGMYGMSVPFAL